MSGVVHVVLIGHRPPNRAEGVVKPDPGRTGSGAAVSPPGVAAILCHGGVESDGQWKLPADNEMHHVDRLAGCREERHEFSR